MAIYKFIVKGIKNPSKINFRIREGRNIDLTVFTGKLINPKFWDQKKECPKKLAEFKEYLSINDYLIQLKADILLRLNEDRPKGIKIDKKWLEDIIKIHDPKNPKKGQSHLLYDLMKAYKDNLPFTVRKNGKVGVSAGTIRCFNTTLARLEKFENNEDHKYLIGEVDFTFHSKYIKFAQKNLGLALNSIGKDIKNIKTVCIDLLGNKKIEVNLASVSKKFNAPSEKTVFTTIDKKEINLIRQFKGSNHLENARDWLIIGCWTGCRVNDLMNLTNDNIHINNEGIRYIKYTQSKTDKTVDVSIHPDVQDILTRLGGFPRPISDQKFNLYIKEVCKAVGMTYKVKGSKQNTKTHKKEVGMFPKWELIKSHTCRRSFATNHYKTMPNKKIMAVTGHKTEDQLLAYIGEQENDHLADFNTLWESDINQPKVELPRKLG